MTKSQRQADSLSALRVTPAMVEAGVAAIGPFFWDDGCLTPGTIYEAVEACLLAALERKASPSLRTSLADRKESRHLRRPA